MKKGKRKDDRGNIYLQDLATSEQSTLDETLEAIDRYFDRPYFNLSEDEQAFFPAAVAAAGLEFLQRADLPTDIGDINDLEAVFDEHCRHQPRRPFLPRLPCISANSIEHEQALADWRVTHSAYWKSLENEPEVRLFTSEKLIAVCRLQDASVNLVDALRAKQPARIFAESMKLTMLAIRAGVFDQVTKGKGFTHNGRQPGAVNDATKYMRDLVSRHPKESTKGLLRIAKEEASERNNYPFEFDYADAGDEGVLWDNSANASRNYRWFEKTASAARTHMKQKNKPKNPTAR